MKKLLAVVLAALMIFQSFAVIAAEPVKISPIKVTADIDLEVIGGENADYSDVLEINTKDDAKFKASIDMESVRTEFETLYEAIEAFNNADIDAEAVALSGDFELILTFDSALKLPESVTKGNNLDGFSKSASVLFREVTRTISVTDVTTFTIVLKVRDGVTAGTINKNLENYLADMRFIGEFEPVVKAGEYSISGELAGSVKGEYTDEDGVEYEGVISFTETSKPFASVAVTAPTYNVTANVEEGATVTFAGSDVLVADNGDVVIEGVIPGNYNLVVTKNGVSKTFMVNVVEGDVNVGDIIFPENIGSTVVTTEPVTDVVVDVKDAAEAYVGTLEDVDTETGKVIVETSVDTYETTPEVDASIKDLIETDKKDVTKVEGLVGVTTNALVYADATVDSYETIAVTDPIEKPIQLVVPYSTYGKENIIVYSQVGDAEPIKLDEAAYVIDTDNGLIRINTNDATANFVVSYEEVKDVVTESTDDSEYEDEDDNSGSSNGDSSGSNKPFRPGNGSTKPDGSFNGDVAIVALYNDVDASHWAYDFIEKMAREGIMNGVGNYTFDPEGPLTRAAVVKMLASLVKAEVAQTKLSFYDVPEAEWYNPYIAWGVANGIVTGYSDTEFGPEDPIYRQDLATMIVRFLNKYNVFLPAVKEKALFADDATIESYAYDFVYTLQCGGVLNGDENNMFHPLDPTTRAEAAKVFSFIVDLYK